MEYRKLGRTGISVSSLCLGTAFRAQDDEATCIRVIDRAIDMGCTFIDTAIYGGGRSEEIVGKALKNKRDEVVLCTKVLNSLGAGPNRDGLSRLNVMRAVEASLDRLQTDHIDLYLLHSFDPHTPLEETLRALDDLVSQARCATSAAPIFALGKSWRRCGPAMRTICTRLSAFKINTT